MRGGHEARARAAHVAGEGGPAAEAVRSAQARAQLSARRVQHFPILVIQWIFQ